MRYQHDTISTTTINKQELKEKSLLLSHIEKCPECVLFLLTSANLSKTLATYTILNEIPYQSQAVFYPTKIKLYYNQPIPYYTILSKNQTEKIITVRQHWLNILRTISHIKNDSILHFICDSLQRPIQTANYSWPNQTKLIMYYTPFFGNPYWYHNDESSVYKNDFDIDHCPLSVNACHITTDPQLFAHTDAALVHMRESLNIQNLRNITRKMHQRFVFFLQESPMNSPTFTRQDYGGIFNYTQTYRPDSDVTATYLNYYFWLFDREIHPEYNFRSIIKTKVNGKIAVALISNCGDSSQRLAYIRELGSFTSVDMYGRCGLPCNHTRDCRQYAMMTYKFYLSFENSLCDQYITEKFFIALHSAQTVPIVLGWGPYDQYVPRAAYIDVRDYESPKRLAEYLNYLDKNTTAYLEYFQWRKHALYIKAPNYMCELCLKLFLDDSEQKNQSLEHVDEYWDRQTQCHSYKRFTNGTWFMQ